MAGVGGRVIRTFAGTGLARAVIFSGSTLLAIVATRAYGTAAFGMLSVALSLAMAMSIVFRGGLVTIFLRNAVGLDDAMIRGSFARYARLMAVQPGRRALVLTALAAAAVALLLDGGPMLVGLFVAVLPITIVGAFAQLRASLYKSLGQPVRASLFDLGTLNLVAALVFVAAALAPVRPPLWATTLAVGVCVTLIGIATIPRWLRLPDHGAPATTEGQGTVMANALTQFMFRNGYPLAFTLFMTNADLGQFRLEERLAFAVTFFFFIIENTAVRPLQRVMAQGGSAWRGVYARQLLLLLAPTVLLATGAAIAAGWEPLRLMVGLREPTPGLALVFVASGLNAVVMFNNVVLNMRGAVRLVSVVLWVTVGLFLVGSFVGYQEAGLPGVRIAYALSSIIGLVVSILLVLRARRPEFSGAS